MTGSAATPGDEERRAAELAALRSTAVRYRELFERNLAGVYRSTTSGRIIEVNPAFARIFGFDSPEEMQDVPARSLYLDQQDRSVHLARLRERGMVESGEVHMRRRDGAPIWVIFSEQLRVTEDGQEIIEGTLLDVTAHKEAEERMLQAGRLAAVGSLAAGVAHEVNNPLAGILANLGYVLETLPTVAAALPAGSAAGQAAREASAALQEARDAAERVRDIVRHLRLFARTEEEVRAPLSLARVLDTVLALLATQLRQRARVERSYAPAPEVSANEARLAQAFLNLLLNALQAMPEADADHHTVRVTLGQTATGDAQVEIADDGAGMGAEVLARAFDPFYSTHAGVGGVGLGLPTARAIVTSLGGRLSVESAPGRGTVARIVLPAATATTPQPRLLVVDDEPGVGKSLARLLAGHEVVVASGGAEALAVLESDRRFDAVLCDLTMPDGSGETLFRTLAQRWPDLARRVVFTLGGAPDAQRRAFLAEAGRPVVEKPFELARLLAAFPA